MKNTAESSSLNEKRYLYPLRNPDNPWKTDLVPVEKDFHDRMTRDIARTRKARQRAGLCACPKKRLWTCDADCDRCPHNLNKSISLDAMTETEKGTVCVSGMKIGQAEDDTEETVLKAESISMLRSAVSRLDKDEQAMCKLIGDGRSERDIANSLSKARRTYTYQRDKLFDSLKSELPH